VVSSIEKSLSIKEYTLIAFLDIERAVNNVLPTGGGCKVVAYADGVAIIFNGKYPQTLCDLMTDSG